MNKGKLKSERAQQLLYIHKQHLPWHNTGHYRPSKSHILTVSHGKQSHSAQQVRKKGREGWREENGKEGLLLSQQKTSLRFKKS